MPVLYEDEDGYDYTHYEAVLKTNLYDQAGQPKLPKQTWSANDINQAIYFIFWCIVGGPIVGPFIYIWRQHVAAGQTGMEALASTWADTQSSWSNFVNNNWRKFWEARATDGGWLNFLESYRIFWEDLKYILAGTIGRTYVLDVPEEEVDDSSLPGYHFYDALIDDSVRNVWNYFTDFLGFVNKTVKLPSGAALFNINSKFVTQVNRWRIKRYKYYSISTQTWSDWISLEDNPYAGLLLCHKTNIPSETYEGYNVHKCWGFGAWAALHEHPESVLADVKIGQSQNWYYFVERLLGVDIFKIGSDEYWLTHGFPYGRDYRLWRDAIGKDFGRVILYTMLIKLFLKATKGIPGKVWEVYWSKTMWRELDATALQSEETNNNVNEMMISEQEQTETLESIWAKFKNAYSPRSGAIQF